MGSRPEAVWPQRVDLMAKKRVEIPESPFPLPREVPVLVGHSGAEETMLASWNSGRMAHAWLITGPRGIGKTTLAFRFARYVLAGGSSGPGMEMPAEDPVFRRVAMASHADLLTLERAFDEKKGQRRSEIVVDDVRAMNHFVVLTPAESNWRVIVVDGAEEMNRNAANALLKHLEEPPPNTLFLLTSHAPARLLPTVVSRCRQLALRPLANAEVSGILRGSSVCGGISDDDLGMLVTLAEGSPGRGMALVEQGGIELYQTLLSLLSGLPDPDVEALHTFGDRLAKKDAVDAFRTVTELLLWWLARIIRTQAQQTGGGSSDAVELMPGGVDLGSRLVASRSLDQWVEVWENVRRLFASTEAINLERKQVFLSAFTMLARAARA